MGKKEKSEDPEKSSKAKDSKKSLNPDAVKNAEDEEEEDKDDKEEDKDGKEEDKDGKEEPEPSAEGKIKTHEVDSVIDKMNMLNEMFEMILKHMDKVIPVHGHDEKDSSGKEKQSLKVTMMMKRKKKRQKVMMKNQQMTKKTKVKKERMKITAKRERKKAQRKVEKRTRKNQVNFLK